MKQSTKDWIYIIVTISVMAILMGMIGFGIEYSSQHKKAVLVEAVKIETEAEVTRKMQAEAIMNGVATWVPGTNGNPIFKWKVVVPGKVGEN